MFIKVKCCKCNNTLHVYVHEENRKKATSTKRLVIGKICCGAIGVECN